ncbi:MAG: beta-propeller domain-containing protein, partial [Desulfococcaceae bacterium]
CSSNTEIGNPKNQSILAFESESALDRYLREQLSRDIVRKTPVEGGAEIPAPNDDFAPPTPAEEGTVRNPVIVTDTVIFAAGLEQVNVLVRSSGNPPELVGVLIGTGRIRSLDRLGDQLIVVGEVESGVSSSARQRVSVWDVSRPERPTRIWAWEIDGVFLGSAISSERLYLAHQFLPAISPFAEDSDPGGNVRKNLDQLNALPMEALFPEFVFREGEGDMAASGLLTPPGAIFRPDWPAGGALTTLTAFNVAGGDVIPSSTSLVGNVSDVFFGEDSAVFGIVRSGDRAGDQLVNENFADAPEDVETTLYRIPFSGGEPTLSHFGFLPGIVPEPGAARVKCGAFQALTVSPSPAGWEVHAVALRLVEDRFALQGLRFLGLEPEVPGVRFDEAVQWVFFPDGRILGVDFSDPAELPEIAPAILAGAPIAATPLDGDDLLVAVRREPGGNGNAFLEFQRLIRENGRLSPVDSGVSIPIPESGIDSRWFVGEVAVDPTSNHLAVPFWAISGESADYTTFSRVFFFRIAVDGGLETIGAVDPETLFSPENGIPPRWIPRFFGNQFGLFRPDGFVFGETADPTGTARWIPLVPVHSS